MKLFRRAPFALVMVVALLVSALAPALAQDSEPNAPDGWNQLFLPVIVDGGAAGGAAAVGSAQWKDLNPDFGPLAPDSVKAGPSKDGKYSYVVLMAGAPAVVYEGGIPGLDATRPAPGQKFDANAAGVRAYTQYLRNQQARALEGVGLGSADAINSYTYALNGFSAILSAEQAVGLAQQAGVVRVMRDTMRYRQTDSSPAFLGLTGPGGIWAKGYTGEGVVVGVIDDGIWPEHPSFADNGAFAPLPGYAGLPCEFGNTAHNPDDAPFTCNNKLIGAREMLETYRALIGFGPDEFDSARDDNGHGTHTASTAAGNANVQAVMYDMPKGVISGVAPRARVIAYKGLGNQGGFTSDLAAAIDQAVADGVHVINYSIGGGAGVPGADELAFLFAADAGVHVATSAGNSGPGAATLGNPGTMPWLTTVGASTQSRFFQGTVVLGNGASYTGASITPGTDGSFPLVDAASAGGDLCSPGSLNPAVVTGKIVLCRRGVVGRAAKSLAVQQAGGVGMIMYENSDTGNLFSDSHWVPSVHVDRTPGLAIKSYIASTSTPTARIDGGQLGKWPYAPSMTDFSSRGPNPVAPDIIKPDITAPGLQILAGWSPFPDPGTLPGELFAAIAGTSMSSPHIAGVLALVKQAHPDWSPAMVKSALMTTAYQDVRDNNRTSPADPFDMGAGHVDPGGKAGKGSIVEPGLAYDAGFLDYLGFLCDAFPSVFGDPASTCADLASLGVPTQAYNLNLPSIGVAEVPGSETVYRTVTSVAKENGVREYTVSVQAPLGYSVSVVPATLRLKRGDKATFAVTITNLSAPVGAWRFGSLTWKDRTGNYEVYSPIAVKGTLFNAPAAVTGSGAAGSASFPVRFGYSGAYTAAPHGLVGATVTSDNVLKDPDQTFDPTDGYSNLHEFNLTGVAQFRIAMPPEATEPEADLDIFVYGPSGALVASSTSGGTEEQVDLVLPPDGKYTVYVHGWSTPGGDSDYDMWTWAVPLVSGGSLSVVSAPTAATIGTVGTIGISWSGLTTGDLSDWYLGAVSHTGASGLMGLTLVEVDNR
jgi:subtilisin family serine protease